LINESSTATQNEVTEAIKESLDQNLKKAVDEELLKNEPLWFSHYVKIEDVHKFKALQA